MRKLPLLFCLWVTFIWPHKSLHAATVQPISPDHIPQDDGSAKYKTDHAVRHTNLVLRPSLGSNKEGTSEVSAAFRRPVLQTPNSTASSTAPPPGTGVPALVAHAAASSGTTNPIPTTGANFAVVCALPGHTVSDSAHNTWSVVENTGVGGFSGSGAQMYVAYGLLTSPTHTFTVSGGVPFTVMAFRNIAGEDQASSTNGPSYPQAVGPITTSNRNELVVGCTEGNMNPSGGSPNSLTVNPPYNVIDFTHPTGANGWPPAVASTYALLGTPASTSIKFNLTQRNGQVSSIAAFHSTANALPPTLSLADPVPESAVNVPYRVSKPDGSTANVAGSCPTVKNGVQPFKYKLSSGAPPAGLSIDPLTGCLTGKPTTAATDASYIVTVTDSLGKTGMASTHASAAATPITLSGKVCPTARQLQPYQCTAVQATGGIGHLRYSNSSDPAYQGLPGGMSINPDTGLISATRVMDQGDYTNVGFSACDTHGGCAAAAIPMNIDGDNTFGSVQLFPKDSVYHLKVRDLPNDTSIRGLIPAYYSGVRLRAEFGADTAMGGMSINTYAANTPMTTVKTSNGGNQFTRGPIPCNAGMEADRNQIPVSETNGEPDLHTLGVYLPGTGADGQPHPAQLYELYNTYPMVDAKGNCTWGNPKDAHGGGYSGAVFPRLDGPDKDLQTTHEMPNPDSTTDAAGLPVAPLLVNYDEVAGGCAKGKECGTIKHPIRISVEKLGQFYQWPATASAPVIHDNCQQGRTADIQRWDQAHPSTCLDGNGKPITQQGVTTVVAGQIYHLPPSTPEPPQCSSNRVSHILFQALVDYGVIPADNGLTGRLIGTKDNRWPPVDTIDACLQQFTLGRMVVANVGITAADPKYGSNKVLPQYVAP